MECYKCSDVTGNWKFDKEICGKCRKVLKVDLVHIILEMEPIYLSETNRNKNGRPGSLTADQENNIKNDRKRGMSFGAISKKYKISKGSVSNVVYNK